MIEIRAIEEEVPIAPRRTSYTRWFWEALGQGIFITSRCRECQRLAFPPRPDCAHCLARAMEWSTLSGNGVLYARTVIHAVPRSLISKAPLSVGLVDLEEGLRIACALDVEDAGLQIGCQVRMVAERYKDATLFRAVRGT